MAAPSVVTVGANAISANSATLIGSVNPNGIATNWWLSYGTTIALGTTTTPVAAGSGIVPVTITSTITSLVPGTTYYFAVVGQSAGGTTTSWTDSFAATSPTPSVATPTVEFGPSSVATPHFDFPFTLTVDPNETAEIAAGEEDADEIEGYAVVVEQGSTEEVAACVKAILACPLNACLQLPGFGVRSLVFSQMPPAVSTLVAQVQQWEPRATLDVTTGLLANQSWAVNLTVSSAGDALT